MDVFTAIKKRHSYRGDFLEKPVPRETLTAVVTAGLQAPSGYNAQTTEFVIVDDPHLLAELRTIVSASALQTAPAAIVVLMRHEEPRNGLYFGVEDYAAAVENVLLAVTASGLATVWIDGALRRENRTSRIADLLDVADDREVRVLLPVGYPREAGAQKEKLRFDQRAWFNGFRKTE
jgi:nitroreductase